MIGVNELYQSAIASLHAGNVVDAERFFRILLRSEPRHVGALNLLTVILISLERHGEAEEFIRSAIATNQNSDASFYNYGIILKKLSRPDEALEQFNRALNLKSDVCETWNSRGTIFNDLKQYKAAIKDFDQAISLNQNYFGAHVNKGKSLSFLKRHDDALAAYDRALAIRPDLEEAWLGRGNLLLDLTRYDEALAAYNKALEINSGIAQAWLGRASVFLGLKRHSDALAAYDKALAIRPDLAEGWLGRGNVYLDLKRYDEALAAYDKALETGPHLEGIDGLRLRMKMAICDWNDFDRECEKLILSIKDNKTKTDPFVLLGIPSSAEDQLRCAKSWVAAKTIDFQLLWQGETYTHKKIRVAYTSTDFHNHATSILLVGVFEKSRGPQFELSGISLGPDDQSEMRQRVKNSFDHFIDATSMSDQTIASLIREKEIDILVDLNGLTKDARPNIFARRPAPIQVNYLGYPGTMGADYIDYIVADHTLIPEHQQRHYAEKIVYLPHSYQANDNKRPLAARSFTRREVGLPENCFVFCCFNNNYKIIPSVFDCWMRILKAVDDSVLWLLKDNEIAAANLRKEAAIRGVASDRLIFATRVPSPDHLARHRLADLFLDTLPYNAHTTASDALWAGVPVLTSRRSDLRWKGGRKPANCSWSA